nr:alanine--tRNA ligase [Nocardia camponoti]
MAEISKRALHFFESRDHTVVPSAPLIADDPTLLLINAGMAPFKRYFLGEATAPFPRATSVQKCVRTVDIEEVGKTSRHGSFFQMFGNFSFGDYFKERAIPLAWEFMTTPTTDGGLGLAEDRLWVTVYQDDPEAEHIWRKLVGVPASRIQRLGMADNFWSMGVPGPCGPCSEICYDRGPEFGQDGGPAANDERYLEIWNLVFMQNTRGEGPAKEGYPILGGLPARNIDTGFGVERMAALLQDVPTIFDIDTTRQILALAAELSGTTYGKSVNTDVSLRVVADHILASTMLIGDGVTPANEGRGYVLRRILRRAVRMMRLLGTDDPVVGELFTKTIDVMGSTYAELIEDRARIHSLGEAEEGAFAKTLKAGTAIFDVAASKAAESRILPGDKAFQLHDTYGFPIDLTVEMAADAGLSVDREGFALRMQEQRARAKADARRRKSGGRGDIDVYRELLAAAPTEFTGYTELESQARVQGVIRDGERVSSASAGEIVEVVLDRTPLYAEGGGQESDAGRITADDVELEVLDVEKIDRKLWVHRVRVVAGEIAEGRNVVARVDSEWRTGARQAHSATHIVHAALRQILGPTALQSGSLNRPGYLRLDFAWQRPLSSETLSEIEEVANRAVRQDFPVGIEYMPLPHARELGALALFGETYDEDVRVVEIGGDWSRELCGGTHVERTAQVGALTFIGESSVGSGLRRLEAHVGLDALRFLASERAMAVKVADLLHVPTAEISDRVSGIIDELRTARKELDTLRAEQRAHLATVLAGHAVTVNGVRVVAEQVAGPSATTELRDLAVQTKAVLEGSPAVVVLAALGSDRPIVVAAVNQQARRLDVAASELVQAAVGALGGRGGGKRDLAQGGGGDARAIPAALESVLAMVARAATQ